MVLGLFGPYWVIFGQFCGIFGQICGQFNFFAAGVAGLAFRMDGRKSGIYQNVTVTPE